MMAIIISIIALLIAIYAAFLSYKLNEFFKRIRIDEEELHYLEKRFNSIKKDVGNFINAYGSVEKALRAIKKIEKDILSLKAAFSDYQGRIDAITSEIEKINALYKEINKDVSRLNSNIELNKNLKEKVKDIEKTQELYNKKIDDYINELESIKDKISEIDNIYKSLTEKDEELSLLLNSFSKSKKDLIKEISFQESKLRQAELEISKIKTDIDALNIPQQFSSLSRRIEKINKALAINNEITKSAKEDLKVLKKSVNKLRTPLVYDIIMNLEEGMKKLSESVYNLDYELSLLRTKIKELDGKYNKLLTPSDIDLALYEKRLNDTKDSIKNIKKILKEMEGGI